MGSQRVKQDLGTEQQPSADSESALTWVLPSAHGLMAPAHCSRPGMSVPGAQLCVWHKVLGAQGVFDK